MGVQLGRMDIQNKHAVDIDYKEECFRTLESLSLRDLPLLALISSARLPKLCGERHITISLVTPYITIAIADELMSQNMR